MILFLKLVIKSLEGVMRESKELYCQIVSINKLKIAVLSQAKHSEGILHDLIFNQISSSKINSKHI